MARPGYQSAARTRLLDRAIPASFANQYYFIGGATFALLPAATLSFFTGRGAARKRAWARWTGAGPCAFLLFGFPFLTAAGAVSLYLLWKQPVVPIRREDFWNPQKQSGCLYLTSIACWFGGFRLTMEFLQISSGRTGAPAADGGRWTILAWIVVPWAHAFAPLEMRMSSLGHTRLVN